MPLRAFKNTLLKIKNLEYYKKERKMKRNIIDIRRSIKQNEIKYERNKAVVNYGR